MIIKNKYIEINLIVKTHLKFIEWIYKHFLEYKVSFSWLQLIPLYSARNYILLPLSYSCNKYYYLLLSFHKNMSCLELVSLSLAWNHCFFYIHNYEFRKRYDLFVRQNEIKNHSTNLHAIITFNRFSHSPKLGFSSTIKHCCHIG